VPSRHARNPPIRNDFFRLAQNMAFAISKVPLPLCEWHACFLLGQRLLLLLQFGPEKAGVA
jgi:hypothetical protein